MYEIAQSLSAGLRLKTIVRKNAASFLEGCLSLSGWLLPSRPMQRPGLSQQQSWSLNAAEQPGTGIHDNQTAMLTLIKN
ncbi:hypothetical protein [Polaromonas sp. CG_9.11]|uniref:hypothetical protein n=1 Tax=Polaromonas sp. CG_9.11 TaxID=2787730 RepID=UPI0018C989A5|nr:hypothetical protein [Polaromonas sp. CG_9.11]MBG6075955.1 hypothetical protein [Polaromonas sp. CG_9.11]